MTVTQWKDGMERKGYQCLTGSTLKIIAIITMLLDHTGAAVIFRGLANKAFNPEYYELWSGVYRIMRDAGRTAFPIFCFLLVEGFCYTRSRKRYALQLFLFALISELPFDYVFYGTVAVWAQNVYFTLLIGLLVIWFAEGIKSFYRKQSRILMVLLQLMVLFAGGFTAYLLGTDYSYKGVVLIYIFYALRNWRSVAGMVGYLSFLWEPWCFPAFLLVQCYNGKRGISLKYLFYLFYPLHLLVLYVFLRLIGWM